MHPTPSALPKRALRGLVGLFFGSLLLLGPAQVSADHDLTCHPTPVAGDGRFDLIGLVNITAPLPALSTLPSPVSSMTPPGDRTDAEARSRTIQDPIAQDGPTTPSPRWRRLPERPARAKRQGPR